MKTQKILSLDIEIVEQLSSIKNASKLINSMLVDYFFSGSDLKKDEIKSKIQLEENSISEKQQKIENLKTKLSQIEKKDKEIKEVFSEIPEFILTDFRMFPKMTEEVLAVRHKNLYSNQIEWEPLLAAFKQYHKKQ